MPIRVYKPTSPARRFMSVLTYEEITKKTPEKSLLQPKKKNAGRNNQGKISVRHQGGGEKQKYRLIDFKRNKLEVPAKVAGIDVQQGKRKTAGTEGFFGQAQQADRILAAREEQGRVAALAGDFTQDMDGLGFQPVEVGEVGGGLLGQCGH